MPRGSICLRELDRLYSSDRSPRTNRDTERQVGHTERQNEKTVRPVSHTACVAPHTLG
jgi:hypothetical protein